MYAYKTHSNKVIVCNICNNRNYHEAYGLCKYCYNELRVLKKHLESPLIRCACSDTCELIHSINRVGLKAMYKSGHNNRGSNHPMWNGGEADNGRGYILVLSPDHPFAAKNGRVLKHRLIMEEKLGRYLKPSEVVHHIDCNPHNNDISNLKVYENNAIHISKTMKKNTSDRRCSICGTDKTSIRKDTGLAMWAFVDSKWLCRRCNRKRLRRLGRNA